MFGIWLPWNSWNPSGVTSKEDAFLYGRRHLGAASRNLGDHIYLSGSPRDVPSKPTVEGTSNPRYHRLACVS